MSVKSTADGSTQNNITADTVHGDMRHIPNQEKAAKQNVTKFLYAKTAGRLGLENTAGKYPRSATISLKNGTTEIVSIFTSISDVIYF